MPLLTVEKKTEHKNGQVNETSVLPKTEAKGQLISEGQFGVFKSTKKKNSALVFKEIELKKVEVLYCLNCP